MAEDYTVQQGDCMSSIAYEKGFFWQTLWKHPSNAALRTQRKNPNVLLPGDIVHIPDLTVRYEPGATETRHKFKRKGVPEKLRMKLLDANHKPRTNVAYIIVIDGDARRGTTDGNGELTESIPPNAKMAKLILETPASGKSPVRRKVTKLRLGGLAPISDVSGLKARLANLGIYKGPIDGNLDDATTRAITAFQKKKGLPATGVADDATKAQLQQVHGH